LSVFAPRGVYGTRKISFEVTSVEMAFAGEITLNIVSVLTREELLQKISTNEFIILQLESEIEKAKARGLDTSKAEEFLENAKKCLQEAKELLKLGKLEEAAEKLLEKDKYLEEVVKELSRIKIPVIVVFPFYIIWIILLLVIIILLLLAWVIKERRKRKEKRPIILRRLGR
jgi:urease gamma subunit